MQETENTQSIAIRVTAHDLATRLNGTLRACARRSISRFRTLGTGLLSTDDVCSDVIFQMVEYPCGVQFDTKNGSIWHIQKMTDRAASTRAKYAYAGGKRVASLFEVGQKGNEYENRGVARYSMRVTANSIENAVYARQLMRVIDGMPSELRKTALFMADGADLIEFAKECGLSLREAMNAQKALRNILSRLLEDNRQEKVDGALP